ncbi:PREDICTED: rho guanine nucleotide exchange factor 17 isoform X2 [Nicrophorus vespilloides]|uniref:Rho guanine nucleotide exchange factor 17 isoform X2 n=1 Tax=Nicrophorus vespilloides TaxID=110193 RepID=A0ABM1M0H4_NICVS|nr:PREDICTED: rho guanine nucleotide exchange factor 17 isoform X2 [Nicrophorus vespilloides]
MYLISISKVVLPYGFRFVTVGSVRYGVRLGAVSPPPPGAGPRYRSQCCWPSTPGPVPVSRIPLLTQSPINSRDIFSCVNRVRMAEDASSDLAEQATVRDQLFNSSKSLLKTQLRRRAFVRSHVYDRLCECGGDGDAGAAADLANNLDRLPRFRFGGNRGTTTKTRERDKRDNELRLKELTDRLKRDRPVPPPRTRFMPPRNPHSPEITTAAAASTNTATTTTTPSSTSATSVAIDQEENGKRNVPHRSASFSQVDYSTHDKKYVRRRVQGPSENVLSDDSISGAALTLPRTKTSTASANRSLSCNDQSDGESMIKPTINITDVNSICEMIYQGCKEQNCPQSTDPAPECVVRNSGVSLEKDSTNAQEKKRDKSRRRKGMYLSQWPNAYQATGEVISQFIEDSEFQQQPPTQPIVIPELQISNPEKTDSAWTTPQESLSPEDDAQTPDWNRPVLSAQNSEEKKSLLIRADSLSEGEPDHRSEIALTDVSDCESRTSVGNDILSPHIPRRYSKRPLRGPYGQMLEAEMKKPEAGRKTQYSNDLKFLEDLSTGSGTCSMVSLSSSSSVGAGDPKPKYVTRSRGNANHSLDDTHIKNNLLSPTKPVTKRKVSVDSQDADNNGKLVVSHQRTTSSPSKLEGFAPTEASSELLEQLLRGSSEQLAAEVNLQRLHDTRTHVVVELYDTERSYVESLHILITKYLEPLKNPDNAGLLDVALVDEVFYQIPSLFMYHDTFLEQLRMRLDHWDAKQKVGDVLLEMFSNPSLIETYTSYVNNWKRARDVWKNAQQSKPAFARFLVAKARENKGKLPLDSLLIKPIQKFPKYELLIQRLIKNTDETHPDHGLLTAAQKELHDQVVKINCTEREALELEQLRDIEGHIEGLIDLASPDRSYLRHDLVSMAVGGTTRKERALFLFSDLLLITSIKRRSGTIRRPATGQTSTMSALDATNKYKLIMKISLDDLEILRTRDENLKQVMVEMENLTEDIAVMNQINELTWTLHCSHGPMDEVIRDMLANLNEQLLKQQTNDTQLSCLDLTINAANGSENVSIVFNSPDKRASWEETISEAKHKLAISGDRRPTPELVATVPIRKTRAGLQFTCAAPTLDDDIKDVWVCNSDGYVGQVCVLSLQPEPTVTSCNGVCNARILCICSVAGLNSEGCSEVVKEHKDAKQKDEPKLPFDSGSSEDEEKHEHMSKITTAIAPAPKPAPKPPKPARTINVVDTSDTVIDYCMDSDEGDCLQCTMWLGTEDGCIHVYNSSDNIRIKKNKIRIQHQSSILCMIYLDDKVYVSLANGDVIIYERDYGSWNVNMPVMVTVGSSTMPVTRLLPNNGKLWCACGNVIKVVCDTTLEPNRQFTVNNDANKPITCMVLSGNGVWLSLQNSAIIKCYHATSMEFLSEVNVASAVTKMLTSCDDIIRQHKAACLRVTALLACKDLLWIGTSAGVLLTMPLPHITTTTVKLTSMPHVVGLPHGHTGHVRFLTNIELDMPLEDQARSSKSAQTTAARTLVISGGDGYEDFRNSNISEVAGREDSTNHLLLWNI